MRMDRKPSGSSANGGGSSRLWGCLKLVGGAFALLLVTSSLLSLFVTGDGTADDQSTAQIADSETNDEAEEVLDSNREPSPEPTETRMATDTPTPLPSPTATSTIAPTPMPTAYAGFSATVRTNANLRAGPGTEFDVVGIAESGEVVTVFRRTDDGWLSLSENDDLWIGSTLVDSSVSLDEIPRPGEDLVSAGIDEPERSSEVEVADVGEDEATEEEATPVTTSVPAATPIPEDAGLTEWITFEGLALGIEDIRWNYSIGYYRADPGKVMVSLYVVAINGSDSQHTFYDWDFGLIDGGREATGGVILGGMEPEFGSCSVLSGGKCEGWWTTMIWDRLEVREDLTFVWDDPCFFCPDHKVKIVQE